MFASSWSVISGSYALPSSGGGACVGCVTLVASGSSFCRSVSIGSYPFSPARRTSSSLAWPPSRCPRGQSSSPAVAPDSLFVTATRSAPSSSSSRTRSVFSSGRCPIHAPPSRRSSGSVTSCLRYGWITSMQGARRSGPAPAQPVAMTEPLDREARDAALAAAGSLDDVRDLAIGCRACDLWRRATQPVFGEGAEGARLLIVGEQPGNSEDLEGAPFVGPSGRMLDRALVDAGIDRSTVYVTNVVKHFKWRRAPSGKRRIHQKPDRAEVEACYPWLRAEVARIRPELIVCLGATAAQAVLGAGFRVTRQHGEVLDSELGPSLGTIHPSAVLRAPDGTREEMHAQLVADLQVAAARLR